MTGTDPVIREAATIILVRRDGGVNRVLMGMRGEAAVFMPSKYVFPGGAVDPEDADAPLCAPLPSHQALRVEAEPRHCQAVNSHAIAAAALRELAEETGLLMGRTGPASPWPGYAEAGLSPDASSLIYLFRAITPPGRPRRFDARFFTADASSISGDPDDFSRACDELSHLHWVPLNEARALNLPFITEVALAELSQMIASVPPDAPLPVPDTVPFFDNRGTTPRFAQIS